MSAARETVNATVAALRRRLAPHFSPDTAAPGFEDVGTGAPSTGHCAAVALIAHVSLGADLMSTRVQGHSHWFNRVDTTDGVPLDFDLTGDQFGLPAVQIAEADHLYSPCRPRTLAEVKAETIDRAKELAHRAGLGEVGRLLSQLGAGP